MHSVTLRSNEPADPRLFTENCRSPLGIMMAISLRESLTWRFLNPEPGLSSISRPTLTMTTAGFGIAARLAGMSARWTDEVKDPLPATYYTCDPGILRCFPRLLQIVWQDQDV